MSELAAGAGPAGLQAAPRSSHAAMRSGAACTSCTVHWVSSGVPPEAKTQRNKVFNTYWEHGIGTA